MVTWRVLVIVEVIGRSHLRARAYGYDFLWWQLGLYCDSRAGKYMYTCICLWYYVITIVRGKAIHDAGVLVGYRYADRIKSYMMQVYWLWWGGGYTYMLGVVFIITFFILRVVGDAYNLLYLLGALGRHDRWHFLCWWTVSRLACGFTHRRRGADFTFMF